MSYNGGPGPGAHCGDRFEDAAVTPPSPTPSAGASRLWLLDAARGLMLVLMALTHLPTRLASPAGQPFGFVSAAEGFVLLSAYMAGRVYSAKQLRDGDGAMREAFLQRALKLYACQFLLLMFLLSVVALIGWVVGQPAILNLIDFYLERPRAALLSGLLLVYAPPLLDILPLYILFMLASPLMLLHARQHGWGGILAASVALWLAAQFGFGPWVYESLTSLVPVPVPYRHTGAFDLWGWQFLWVLGLWLGNGHARDPQAPPLVFPRWMLRTAVAIAATGFVWRHAVGQVPFPTLPDWAPLFDKWHLGPLRLLNLFALLVLAMHFAPWIERRLPRPAALELLGRASLPVFCAHLVVALLALALAGEALPERPWSIDALILVGGFALLFAVALASDTIDRRVAARRQRRRAAPLRAAVSARPTS